MKITFTDTIGIPSDYGPRPAARAIPAWYKDMSKFVDEQRIFVDGHTPHTIKACVPVRDALLAGYILVTPADIQVSERDGLPYYEWPMVGLGFHPVEQAPQHPHGNGAPFPKFVNPWAIRTPNGYSTLFVPPLHNPNGMFTILPGIVDTDKYFSPVNLPFALDDVKWRGVIPAGTAMAQVIPFRRDSWTMTLGQQSEVKKSEAVSTRLRALLFDSYRRQFWARKIYR